MWAGVGHLHRTITAFLSDHPSVGTHRPRARAAFWTLPTGELGVAATAAWMRLTDADGPGYGVTGLDALDEEAVAEVDAAIRTGARCCVVHGVAGTPPRWFEVSTWPLTSRTGDTVATAATITEVPEPCRPASSGPGVAGATLVSTSRLATPSPPRVPMYATRSGRR